MKIYKRLLLIIVVTLGCLVVISSQVQAGIEPGKWDTVSKEISEAAKAVGDASGESWQKTKEITAETMLNAQETGIEVWGKTKDKSSELFGKTVEISGNVAEGTAEKSKGLWQKTKEISKEWWEKGKAKMHKLTEPEPQQFEPEPQQLSV